MAKQNNKGRGGSSPRHGIRLYQLHDRQPGLARSSAIPRTIYIELARRFAGSNNGRIVFSVRQAASELRIGTATASRALTCLVEHGFVVPMSKGAFSFKKRHAATEWRLTEFPCDVTHAIAGTKEFMRWQPKAVAATNIEPSRRSVRRRSEAPTPGKLWHSRCDGNCQIQKAAPDGFTTHVPCHFGNIGSTTDNRSVPPQLPTVSPQLP